MCNNQPLFLTARPKWLWLTTQLQGANMRLGILLMFLEIFCTIIQVCVSPFSCFELLFLLTKSVSYNVYFVTHVLFFPP